MELSNIVKGLLPTRWVRRMRLYPILKDQKKVADFWLPIIEDYFNGHIQSYSFTKKKKVSNKVIWQYWGQGVNNGANIPEVVRICFDSVDKYKEDYEVVRLSDETISEYIDLPPFVYEKLKYNDAFTRTFFSDLLRVALLTTYGGVWLDATILLTDRLPQAYSEMGYFICTSAP